MTLVHKWQWFSTHQLMFYLDIYAFMRLQSCICRWPAIRKLDKKIIALHKTICGLPKSTINIATQLPHDLFGIEAFSLKNAYLRCIGEQLQNALNDKGRLGKIYHGLIQFVLAKFGGSKELTRIKYYHYVRSPLTRTLFLLKHEAGIHLKSTLGNFLLNSSPLETAWFNEAQNLQGLNPNTSLNYYKNS